MVFVSLHYVLHGVIIVSYGMTLEILRPGLMNSIYNMLISTYTLLTINPDDWYDILSTASITWRQSYYGILLSITTFIPTAFHVFAVICVYISKILDPILRAVVVQAHELLIEQGEAGRSAVITVVMGGASVVLAGVLVALFLLRAGN